MVPENDHIRQLFEQIDENNDGRLCEANIARHIQALVKSDSFHSATAEKYSKQLVSACGKSKDGTVSYKEFEEFAVEKENRLGALLKQPNTIQDMMQARKRDISESKLNSFIRHCEGDLPSLRSEDWKVNSCNVESIAFGSSQQFAQGCFGRLPVIFKHGC